MKKNVENYQFEVTETHVKLIRDNGCETWPISKYGSVEATKQKFADHYDEKAKEAALREELMSMSWEERVKSKHFAYTRQRFYGVSIYVKWKWSPTGVVQMGGVPDDEVHKLKDKKSPLSPTEDLRSAR